MRVLIADDHGIVRSGLRKLLESEEGIEVVAEAATVARPAIALSRNGPTWRSSTSRCRGWAASRRRAIRESAPRCRC